VNPTLLIEKKHKEESEIERRTLINCFYTSDVLGIDIGYQYVINRPA